MHATRRGQFALLPGHLFHDFSPGLINVLAAGIQQPLSSLDVKFLGKFADRIVEFRVLCFTQLLGALDPFRLVAPRRRSRLDFLAARSQATRRKKGFESE